MLLNANRNAGVSKAEIEAVFARLLESTRSSGCLANGAIIMPAYGVAADRAATEVLERAFPGREIVPVRVNQLAHGGGEVHCITQQQPAWPRGRRQVSAPYCPRRLTP
ncbi:agmatine deiminase family protein [Halomonas nitroreducens]|uniref:agmatine deiminase family protein n=1 Tax=Halomonas nitroreducens TaxID=447425 RepID=UPI003CCC4744